MTVAAPAHAAQPAVTAADIRAARTRLLIEGRVGPTLARLAAPNVIAMFAMAATSIAEGVFAGVLGVSALAGLALVFPLVMLTQMLSAGANGGAVSAAIARALGADDVARAERLMLHVWIIAFVAALASAFLMALCGEALFALLGGRDQALAAGLDYAGVFFPGCIAIWLCHSLLSVVRGTGRMAMPALVLLLASLGTVPLSGALALGWGPLPALGMAGLAGGQVAAYGFGALVAFGYTALGGTGLSVANAFGRLDGALFWDVLRVSLVASVSAVQTVLTVVIMVGLVGLFGVDALAGYGLGARLEFLMIPIVFGIGAAMTAMVGVNIGARRRERALAIAWTGSLAAAAIVGAIGIVLALAPELWLGLFLDAADGAALAAGRAYFRLVGPFYAFFALGLALYFASQGAGRMAWPVAASIARMAVAVGGGVLLTQGMGAGLEGVFAAIAAGMVIYGLSTAVAVRLTGWLPRTRRGASAEGS